MSNGKNPLMLMMALSMPGAVHALGLGDIHVDSGLNERLAAEIDIVGATAADLTDLQAAVANRETFLRYGADRPAFLSSAIFKVTQDAQGRPVLAVRSTEAFTEPMVNFLVDLHWRNGELVRQYTLLLDPPGFASAPTAPAIPLLPMAAVPAAATPVVETKTQTVARQADPPTDQFKPKGADRAARRTTRIKVGAKATLRGIAWRVGERSASDLQRMMIALFRANPGAFDGNINRLRLGAVLTVPSFAEVAAISKAEAQREFHAQMAAWHSPARAPASASTPVAPAATASAPPVTAPVAAPPSVELRASASAAADTDKLNSRVQSLEQELADVHGLLESQRDTLLAMQQQAAAADKASTMADAAVQPEKSERSTVPIVAGISLLAAALAGLYVRLRRRAPKVRDSRDDAEPAPEAALDVAPDDLQAPAAAAAKDLASLGASPARTQEEGRDDGRSSPPAHSDADDGDTLEAPAPNFDEQTHPLIPVMASPAMPKRVNYSAATISRPEHDGGTTVNLVVDSTARFPSEASRVELTRVDTMRLDYNLVDLDMTAQHVQMPSVLNEHAVVKERRTNLADVLRMAIEREPDRHDLRMKLLELYYSAAATNRQAFLEVVQKFARDREYLHADQWEKIASMGRQIAAENPMFAEPSASDEDLADCA